MAATEQGQDLHLTMANEDYLECMVRIEQEEGAEGGVRSVDIAALQAALREIGGCLHGRQ